MPNSLRTRYGYLVQEAKPRTVALDLSGVFDLEYRALKMLANAEKRNRENGIRRWLVGMNPEVLSMIQKSSLGKALGRDGMHFNLETAVALFLDDAQHKHDAQHIRVVREAPKQMAKDGRLPKESSSN
jgi:STAS domain